MNRIFPVALLAAVLGLTPASAAQLKSITAAGEQAGNEAIKAFDQDAGTRWAMQGRGTWIQCELDQEVELSSVGIGFQSAERNYSFEMTTSNDGKNWNNPVKLQSESRSGVVTYKLPARKARWLRLTVFGSNENDWANVHTIHLPGITPGVALVQDVGKKPQFVVTEWATDPAIANTVAISVDDQGRAYVTAARRRKQSSLDIRNHQDLVKKDLSLTTVEERRAGYRE